MHLVQPFPSGTEKAILSFGIKLHEYSSKDDGVKRVQIRSKLDLSVITSPRKVSLDFSRSVNGKVMMDSDASRRRERFKSEKCMTCQYFKTNTDSIISNPKLINDLTKESSITDLCDKIKNLSEDADCKGIKSLDNTSLYKCRAGFIVKGFTFWNMLLDINVPKLVLTLSAGVYSESIPDTKDAATLEQYTKDISYVKDRGHWMLHKLWDDDPEEMLIRPYRISNVGGDGSICWGDLNYPRDPKTAMSSFWSSNFNFDLHDDNRTTGKGLRTAIQSYECPPSDRISFNTLHSTNKSKLVHANEPKGFIYSDNNLLMQQVPAKYHVKILKGPAKVFGWIEATTKITAADGSIKTSALINCRGFYIRVDDLNNPTKVITIDANDALKLIDKKKSIAVKPQLKKSKPKQKSNAVRPSTPRRVRRDRVSPGRTPAPAAEVSQNS
jgi:hypothetical protein